MVDRQPRGQEALPSGLRRLWGMDEGPRPGQRPSLDVRQVARAAIALADEGGLDAVSMGRVANALGVTTMALYRYVDGKDDLLELMLEVAAGDPPPLAEGLDWRAALRAWADALAAVYRRHPWIVDIPLPGPPRGPHQLAWTEQGLACLRDTTLRADERFSVTMLALAYVRGQVSLERQIAEGPGRVGDDTRAERDFEDLVRGLDPDRFPELTRAMAEDPGGEDPVHEASFGLERILDGVEVLLARRAATGEA
jgi:AcrR family transcriptional regulator